jgi:tRNA1(Val) A37 N6-methylase TrmN6
MSPQLKSGERIEDLQFKGLRIIQSESGFRFGTDSVLLAGFANVGSKDRVADLGSGTGVMAILLEGRTGARLTGIEIQAVQCDMASRSAELNGQKIDFINADMRKVHELIGTGVFDAAICNPPYYPQNAGEVSRKGEGGFEGAATHELYCTLEEVSLTASRLIKYGGKLFICCPAGRLSEMFCSLTANGLEPKRLRLVSSRADKPPYLALIEAKKGASKGLRIETPLIVCDADGNHTPEVRRIYHEEEEQE